MMKVDLVMSHDTGLLHRQHKTLIQYYFLIFSDVESEDCDSPSRPDSANGDSSSPKKRIYKKKLFPQFEMRTRGAKLPNFALKMASWTWGKESYVPAKKQRRLSSDTTK
jgi:hypothetical protein